MNWFQRHINGTMMMGWVLAWIIIFIAIYFYVMGAMFMKIQPNVMAPFIQVFPICSLAVSIWGCKAKGRSGWYSLTILIPLIGWIILLVLKNKR
jgi:uncharacterized membrane protein YhaH (DUF805 family)